MEGGRRKISTRWLRVLSNEKRFGRTTASGARLRFKKDWPQIESTMKKTEGRHRGLGGGET